ncbi:cation:proton antiporter [Candidatus Latescibacterota bacterium]
MLNIISFLIFTVAAVVGIKNGYVPNQLFNLGSLIVLAYILSLVMRFLNFPEILAYILAGIAAGPYGLGFISEEFPTGMSLVESIVMMLLVSETVRYMFKNQPLGNFKKFAAIGFLSSAGILLISIVLLSPFSMPFEGKITLGLFAATFSPLVVYGLSNKNELPQPYIQIAFSGYICALLLWGILIIIPGSSSSHRVRLAIMPAVIGLTSTTAGFVWAYLTDKLAGQSSKKHNIFLQFAILFLIFPLCGELGFDYLFVAMGVGVYNGIISEKEEGNLENIKLFSLLIFSFFGLKLSIQDTILMSSTGWKLALILTSVIVFSRLIILKLFINFISPSDKSVLPLFYFIPYGPMAFILSFRFIPKFREELQGDFSIFHLFSVCTTTIIIIFILTPVFNLLFRLKTRNNNI